MMSADRSEQQKHTRIEIVGQINQPIQYSNYAEVQITPLEALITFARVDPATAVSDSGDAVATSVDAPAVARIALPHQVIVGLYRAIRAQCERRGLEILDEEK
ncbi:MAG: hypothetical protein ACOX9R_14280 [Armatimonadota bacterium]|jgi:hypothetical protein